MHSVRYDRLPDWFLGFDVYDRGAVQFWSTGRRDRLLEGLGLARVPRVAMGRFTGEQVRALLGKSKVGSHPAEGLYLRRDGGDWLAARAKVVRPEFMQQIEEHWKSRPLEKNALATPELGCG